MSREEEFMEPKILTARFEETRTGGLGHSREESMLIAFKYLKDCQMQGRIGWCCVAPSWKPRINKEKLKGKRC